MRTDIQIELFDCRMHLNDDAFLWLDEEIILNILLDDNLIVAFVISFFIWLTFRLSYKLEIQWVICTLHTLNH